jgi:hypothetical protein
MQNHQFGEAVQELLENGWNWDGRTLTSPSNASIDNPTADEILKLRTGMRVKDVIAERDI